MKIKPLKSRLIVLKKIKKFKDGLLYKLLELYHLFYQKIYTTILNQQFDKVILFLGSLLFVAFICPLIIEN